MNQESGHFHLFFLLAFLVSCFFFLADVPDARAQTNVGGSITTDTTWTTAGSPYVLNCHATVEPDVVLTIQPGVVIKGRNPSCDLVVKGFLKADGAIFTSWKDDAHGGDTNGDGAATTPVPADWHGIYFQTGNNTRPESSYLSNSSVIYGGNATGFAGAVAISGSGTPASINATTVSFSYNDGFYVYASTTAPLVSGSSFTDNGDDGLESAVPLSTLSGNSFTGNGNNALVIPAIIGGEVRDNSYSGNADVNGMYLTGHITADTTWPASNSPYVPETVYGNYGYGHMDVLAGVTLTISPGSVVKFPAVISGGAHNNTDHSIEVLGGLIADGVTFTSFFDDTDGGDTNGDGVATSPEPGDWYYVAFKTGSTGSIANSILRYGGSRPKYRDRGQLFIDGSSPTISGNAIHHSLSSNIFVYSGTPQIHNNDIFTNPNNYSGVHNKDNTNIFDATNNWWGGKGGPRPHGTGAEALNVDASPWSDVPFTQEGLEAQAMGTDTWCGAFGEPVNTSTGAFYYEHTDMEIPTKGLPLKFERTYNSNDAGDGPLGWGWSFSWQVSANPRANGDVVILRGDGRRDTFTLDPDGSYSPPAGRYDTLTKNPDGTFTLLGQDQTTYGFNTNNRLLSVTAENGQALTLSYDTSLRLSSITDPAGRSLALTYNAENRIERIDGPLSTSVSFSYSPQGELLRVSDQTGGITSFTYDEEHRITSITDPVANENLIAVPFVVNTYDPYGRVVEQRDAEGNLITFDYSVPNQTTMTRVMEPNDPEDDQVTLHRYDAAFRLTQEVDPLGGVTTYTYDAAGNRETVTDRRGYITKQLFDSYGNVTDTYRAFGTAQEQHIATAYNLKNHPLTSTDARGNTTTFTYDAAGSYLLQIGYPQVTNYDGTLSSYSESFTYNPDGTLATSTDRNGDTTTYTYDVNGYPAVVTINSNRPAAEQIILDYGYDALGRMTSQTDGGGNTTAYGYNPIGDLLSVTRQVTDPDTQQLVDVTTTYSYDKNGNRVSVTDPEGRTTSYQYTAMDRLRLITDARGNTIEHTYDAALNRTGTRDRSGNWTYLTYDPGNRLAQITDPEGYVTAYAYDGEGNQVSATDPLARTTQRSYDALGRMTSVSEPDEGGAVRTTNYAYDQADNLLSTTDPANYTAAYAYDQLGRLKAATDPTGHSTFYAFDGEGNRSKTRDQRGFETLFSYSPSDTLTQVTDPMGGVTAYAYDKNGNMTSQTDALGHTTYYAYDELGSLTEEKTEDGAGGYLLERDYRYDKAGNLTRDTTGEGAIGYGYDEVYNLTAVTGRQGETYSFSYDNNQNQTAATEDASGRTVSYSYDQRGLIASYSDAHGAQESFTYDGAANLTQSDDTVGGHEITTTYGYTPRNQQKSVSRAGDTTSFTYDAAGRLDTKSYANGLISLYSYDAAGRITGLETVKEGQTMDSYSQSYDPAGNLTGLYDMRYGSSSFSYDALNRLTEENHQGYGQIEYTYDKAGNRLTLTTPQPAGGPALALSTLSVYWASWQDYQESKLSIDYRITNNGPGAATEAEVTNSTATNGAYLLTGMPMSLGEISEATYSDFTLKYQIPAGVGSILTTVYLKCRDTEGTAHYYPEKRDFYSYNAANQLTEINDQDANITAFTYNANGALTGKAMGGVGNSYSYNGLDKLTGALTPTGSVNYTYDALGRRITRSENSDTYNLIYGATSDLIDYGTFPDGSLASSFLKGPDGLISISGGGYTAWQSFNPHGDTTLISGPGGEEWIDARYDAFGNLLDGWELNYGYTSKWLREKDDDTMQIRMGIREYDPALGRFTSADPLKGTATDPQQRNRYTYTGNNPLVRYDLNGLSWYDPRTWLDDEDKNKSQGLDEQGNRVSLPPYNDTSNFSADECVGAQPSSYSHMTKCEGKAFKREGMDVLITGIGLNYTGSIGRRGPTMVVLGAGVMTGGICAEYVVAPVLEYFDY